MKKNIGILFPSSKQGGVFQFALCIADSLITYSDQFDYTIVHYQSEKPNLFFNKQGVSPNYLAVPNPPISLIKKIFHLFGLAFGINLFLNKTLTKVLKNANLDLLIIPTPFGFNVPLNVPYIVSLPDYMDKYYPDFPEYTLATKFLRAIVYRYYGLKSVLVVADSKQGVEDIHKFSRIEREKCRIIYYIPPSYVFRYKEMDKQTADELLSKYHVPSKFIFYPAQFWFQKNHFRLIKALNLIKGRNKIKIPLVLVGNAKGNPIYERVYRELMALVKNLDISDQIIHLGYVSEKEMIALYKRALALIAPPFQGPTTIPPLEAMVLGTPVATINLFELPKQIGKAGVFFDPLSVEEMADKIYMLWQDEALRRRMIKAGYEQSKNMTQKNYDQKWEKVILEALNKINQRFDAISH